MTNTDDDNIMQAAVNEVGSQSELAKRIGCSQPMVSQMVAAGQPTPRYAPKISQVTGIPLSRLRPDLYGLTNQQQDTAVAVNS